MLHIRHLLIIGGIIFTIIAHGNALAMEDENNLPTQTNLFEDEPLPQFENLQNAYKFFTTLPPQATSDTTSNNSSDAREKQHFFIIARSDGTNQRLMMSITAMQLLLNYAGCL